MVFGAAAILLRQRLDADGGGLAGGDGVARRHDGRVEAAGRAQRDGEDRPVAVDGVVGEQDRDLQPRLGHRDLLQVVDLGRVGEAEHRADAVAGVLVGDLAVGEEHQLLELLLEGHLREKLVDLPLDALVGGAAGSRERGLVG